MESLVHQCAVHHIHRAPDGRRGREDGLSVPSKNTDSNSSAAQWDGNVPGLCCPVRWPRGAAEHLNEQWLNRENKLFFPIHLFITFFFFWLYWCAWAFSSCRELGLLFTVVRELLIAVASFVAEHGL